MDVETNALTDKDAQGEYKMNVETNVLTGQRQTSVSERDKCFISN